MSNLDYKPNNLYNHAIYDLGYSIKDAKEYVEEINANNIFEIAYWEAIEELKLSHKASVEYANQFIKKLI